MIRKGSCWRPTTSASTRTKTGEQSRPPARHVGPTVIADSSNNSSQQATDAGGAVYSVDSGAAIYANDDSSTFLEQINPGNSVKGALVFDVPKGTKLTSVVLHESLFTAGVKIPLK